MSKENTAEERIGEWLDTHPGGCHLIAKCAVTSLYLGKTGQALGTDEMFGSGADYQETMGNIFYTAGIHALLTEMMLETDEKEK